MSISITISITIKITLAIALVIAKNAPTEEEGQELMNQYYELYHAYNAERVQLAKMEALRYLESEVREYIRWAKAQQGY